MMTEDHHACMSLRYAAEARSLLSFTAVKADKKFKNYWGDLCEAYKGQHQKDWGFAQPLESEKWIENRECL